MSEPQPAATDATGTPTLHLQRTYPATPDRVWRAWTDPAALSRWFGPGEPDSVVVADLDLRVGGRYHIGFTTPDGERHDVSGSYEVVEPPRRLVFTWAWKSTPGRISRVTVALAPVAGGTALDFLHERFADVTARDNHRRGWEPSLAKLGTFLRTAA